MKLTPKKINSYLLFKLPSAYFTGVRVKSITEEKSVIGIKYNYASKNPFKSIFWAVQGMAAELSSGVLVMDAIAKSGKKVSMLVINMNATFTKKATGKVVFECNDGLKIKETIKKAVETGEGQTITVTSEGINEDGVSVSKFQFEWSFKVKSS